MIPHLHEWSGKDKHDNEDDDGDKVHDGYEEGNPSSPPPSSWLSPLIAKQYSRWGGKVNRNEYSKRQQWTGESCGGGWESGWTYLIKKFVIMKKMVGSAVGNDLSEISLAALC